MAAKVLSFLEASTDVIGLYAYCLQAVEHELEAQLSESKFVDRLNLAISHAIFPAGKRVRPVFAALLCSDLGGDPLGLIPAATSIEYLHTASLIHDDLPSLDNDDMRRGRPSCHAQFGEATAVLAADALVGFAFRHLCDVALPDSQRLAMIRALSIAYIRLCDGQQLDLLGSEDLLRVYALKTGALFSAAAEFAGIATGLDMARLAECRRLGDSVGRYFQVVDDYIDRYGDFSLRGRVGSSDEKNERRTVFSEKEREASAVVQAERQAIEDSLGRLQEGSHVPLSFKGIRMVISKIDARLMDADNGDLIKQ